jgi:hypothetical protein
LAEGEQRARSSFQTFLLKFPSLEVTGLPRNAETLEMRSFPRNLLLAVLSGLTLVESLNCDPPAVNLDNGTYLGLYNQEYDQDFFLGIPYAQPPVGPLRFAAPQPLRESFGDPRNATEYGWMCIGYGSDTANLGNPVDEDCLTLNVVRPAGVKPGDDLPVGVWVHGGVSSQLLKS